MGIGVGIFLIAVGAILRYAVNASVSGIELQTVGLILMLVGSVGLAISLIAMTTWRDLVDRRTVVRERDL